MSQRSLSVNQARELDRRAVSELGLPTLLLMENAARGVAERARALGSRWVILCGAGNNGGDGLAAARHLGYEAIVHLLATPDPAKCPDAALQLRVLERAGFAIQSGDPEPAAYGPEVVWIDALFGTGLTRPLSGRAAEWVARFDRAAGPKLSIDLPSGLDGDNGEALGGISCHADETVTFHAPKHGLLVPSARAYVGRLSVVPLGLPPGWPRRIAFRAKLARGAPWSRLPGTAAPFPRSSAPCVLPLSCSACSRPARCSRPLSRRNPRTIWSRCA